MRDSVPRQQINDDRSHIEGVLRSSGWLSQCSDSLRTKLLKLGRVNRLEPGETLFRYGDPPEGIFGVATGAVHIGVPADDGQELVIYHADKGFWVGDLELFSDGPRMATVTAATHTLCLFFSKPGLVDLLAAYPQFYRDFYRMSYENGYAIMRTLANMTVTGSDRRLALRILQYDERKTDADAWIAIAQSQLAMTTALSLPTLERVLRKMASAGLVEVGYGKIRILDRQGLRNLARS
ncbi:MAG: Crp/Fnr family transcriptional regulator [Pseudomonadota bacterium]